MNIAFAKIGKSIKFLSNDYSPTGGDNESSALLCAVANKNPDKTFYIIGRSDFRLLSVQDRHRLFPYGNVIDVWESRSTTYDENYLYYISNYFNEKKIKIDFAIMMWGTSGVCTIEGKTLKVSSEHELTTVINMTKKYASPIIWWLNESMTPYVEIINDPRYSSYKPRDLMNHPRVSLGQYDYTYTRKSIRSYEDQTRVETDIKSVYAGMETLFCIGRHRPTSFSSKKSNMAIVLNEGKPSRYNILKEWVLDTTDGVKIYGAWEDERASDDSRFVGSRHIDEIQRIMTDTKYTFVIPIKKGWVTSKYIEMIHAGVIPFFHPTYDEQFHLNTPSILRPKTPTDMNKSIDLLNRDDSLRVQLIEQLQHEFCKPSYYDGSFINNVVMSSMIDNYTSPNLALYTKKDRSFCLEDLM